jgi:uncharacterized membrane-anchored protein YhcB (DUF1043 family)
MFEILHAFGAGIAFIAGLALGFWTMMTANRASRKELLDHCNAHQGRVEDRLQKYVEHTERIAVATEALLKGKQ